MEKLKADNCGYVKQFVELFDLQVFESNNPNAIGIGDKIMVGGYPYTKIDPEGDSRWTYDNHASQISCISGGVFFEYKKGICKSSARNQFGQILN